MLRPVKYHNCTVCDRIRIETEDGPMWIYRNLIQGGPRLSWEGDIICPDCEKQAKLLKAAGQVH